MWYLSGGALIGDSENFTRRLLWSNLLQPHDLSIDPDS